MAVKLNAPMQELVKIDPDTHPLFVKIWEDPAIERLTEKNFDAFLSRSGLAAVCLVDDPVMYKETLDMCVIGPELFKLFGDTPVACGFSDPRSGRKIASGLGIHRLPALAVFRFGSLMGAVEGLKNWADYESELVSILMGGSEPKKKQITIGNA